MISHRPVYPVASFSDLTPGIYTAGGTCNRFCRIHKEVKPVLYQGRSSGPVETACPTCLEQHLGKPVVAAKQTLGFMSEEEEFERAWSTL